MPQIAKIIEMGIYCQKIYKYILKIIKKLFFFHTRFEVLLTSQKLLIMKTLKVLFIAAIFSLGIFASCTPESIQDEQAPQQIEKSKIIIPSNG